MAAVGGAYFHYMLYSETFRNSLLQNVSMNLVIVWHECPLGGPLLDLEVLIQQTNGLCGRGLFSLYDNYNTNL